MSRKTQVTARRTTLRTGMAEPYDHIHRAIPEPVATALREAGVVDWAIWRDGDLLFHRIETVAGYDAMETELRRRGPIDPDWDRVIAGLLSSAPGADVRLPLVWSMDADGQGPAHP